MSNVESNVLHIVDTLNNGFEGYLTENEYGETQTAFDYLQDVLDFNWILNSDRTMKGARLLVAFGGPNIWIDTQRGIVDGSWWSDRASASFKDNLGLDEALSELWNCK